METPLVGPLSFLVFNTQRNWGSPCLLIRRRAPTGACIWHRMRWQPQTAPLSLRRMAHSCAGSRRGPPGWRVSQIRCASRRCGEPSRSSAKSRSRRNPHGRVRLPGGRRVNHPQRASPRGRPGGGGCSLNAPGSAVNRRRLGRGSPSRRTRSRSAFPSSSACHLTGPGATLDSWIHCRSGNGVAVGSPAQPPITSTT
jgi:hypothetical protein